MPRMAQGRQKRSGQEVPAVPHPDDLLTVPQVCAALGNVSRSTFYYWRQTGKAPRCTRLPNGELRVSRGDLKEWLDRLREVA